MSKHKNSGGNQMSLKKSAIRLSLLAGSSLAVGMAFAPTAALAADECGNPSANAAAADSFTCATPPTYATGVDYSTTTNGDLTVILQNRFDTGTAGTGGIRMFGKAGEDMTLIREDSPAGAGDPRIVNTAGRAIDVSTLGDGNAVINLTDGDPTSETSTNVTTGTAPIRITGSTDAIRAQAAGSGNVSVIFAPTGTPSGVNNPLAVITAGANVAGGSGIVARTTTGDIAIDARGASFSINSTNGGGSIDAVSTSGGDISLQTGSVGGRLFGIHAAATGAGVVTINSGGVSMTSATGAAALDLSTGTGQLTVNAGGVSVGTSVDAHALRLVSGGNATINVSSLNGRGLTKAVLDLTTASGTLTTLTSTGQIGISVNTNTLMPYSTMAITGRGGGDIQISTTNLRGLVDFSALTGDAGVSVAGLWDIEGTSRFGSGDDTVSMGAAGVLNVYSRAQGGTVSSTIVFAGGDDTFNNAGVVRFDPFGVRSKITLTLEGLEAFNNSGVIRLGSISGSATALTTDGDPDDVLMMPGATFTGSGDSLILMDVSYGSPSQTACDVALRDATTGEMPAADCIGIQGGATAGLTKLLVKDRVPGDRGFNNSIVLVDVAGGTSEAGHFVLDERSDHYSPENGGVIDKKLLTYALVYDADVQQHMLLSTPGANALQFALLPSIAQSLWRTSTGTWFERQADLRVGELPELGGGVWLRLAGEMADRDAIQTVETASATLEYDGSFEQKSYAITGGIDLLAASGASSAYVVGVMAGYANAKFEYAETANTGSYDGFSVGGYASFLAGGLFVDAAVNANRLVLKEDIPSLNLFPAGTILDTNLVSVGGQVEAGWRFAVMEGAFVEPLASASYVRVRYDALEIPSDDSARPRIGVDYDDPTSLRAGLGGRIGLEQDYGAVRAQYSLLARAWNEFEGENAADLTSVAGDTLMVDDFSGQFNELGVGASVYSPGGIVSGFVNLGSKFGDDYDAKTGSVGVRVAW